MSDEQLATAVANLAAVNHDLKNTILGIQTNCAVSADSAQDSATEALAQADIASDEALKASQWANAPVDQVVESGKFSSYHWSQKAAIAIDGVPEKVTKLTSAVYAAAQQGARQEDFSSNYAVRYDLLDVNGSSVIRGCQAFCFDEINRHLYITEGGAISRYPMDGDVGVNTLDTTGIGGTAIGHQGLAVERINGTRNIKLWTTSTVVGRSAVRFDYVAGTPVNTGDVYELFPSGNYADSTSCTPTVSQCNRYLLAHGTVFGQVTNTMIRVFRISDLLARGPGNCTDLALYEWPTQNILVDSLNPFQGMACDGQNVYTIAGGTGFTSDVKKRVNVYTLQGELLQADNDIIIGKDIALTDGDGTRWEPEGLSITTAPGGGLTLMFGMLSGQPSQRRFRIYGAGLKKPLVGHKLRLLNNEGSNFYSAELGVSSATPEGSISGIPGDLRLTKLGKAFIKKSGVNTSANWGELMDRAESLLQMQSFGLGSTGNSNISTDLSLWRTTATFVIDVTSSVAAGLPITTVGHLIRHEAGSATNGHTQTATPLTSVAANKNRRWYRQMWAGVWTAWDEIASVASVTAAVDAVIETGVTSGTTWDKFDSGLLVVQIAPFNMAVAANAATTSPVLTSPVAFVGNVGISANGIPSASNIQYGFVSGITVSTTTFQVVHLNGATAQNMNNVIVTLTGRWK